MIAAAMAITLALAALATAAAQQEPPYRYYGTEATAGDEIMVYDALGHEAGSTTVASDGSWYIDVDRDRAENASFTINGEQAQPDITRTGAGQSMITLTLATTDDEFSLQEDEDSLEDDQGDSAGGADQMFGFPNAGSAGLAGADAGSDAAMSDVMSDAMMSDALIGLISALLAIGAAAALGGWRWRRTRRRAV